MKPSNVTTTQSTTSTCNSSATAAPSVTNSSTVLKKQRPLLPKETAQLGQTALVWNQAGNKVQASSPKLQVQKGQKQQPQQQSGQTTTQPQSPVTSNNASTRYQTRQTAKGLKTHTLSNLH